jgi:prolyl-tRNA editing enzyme YbaK/EbsC (Cys-tRNA(Pro) deacylase)
MPVNAHEAILSKLNEHGVKYKVHTHELLLSSADAYTRNNFEFNVEDCFKTLAFQVHDCLILIVIHGQSKVDYKKICEILKINRRDLKVADSEYLLSLGYSPGGISPISVTETTKVIIDAEVLNYETVVCGAGDGTHSLEVSTKNLLAVTSAAVCGIAKK